MSVKNVLELFGKRVQQQSKSNLSKKGKKDTSELYHSIGYEVKVSKNSFHLSFKMADYGMFVDKGVKGKTSSDKAPNSPFRFGSGTGKKGGLTDGINGWVKRKRLQFKERGTGKFLSYQSTAFLITRAIYNKGIETTNFFTKPFENEFKKLPEEVVEAYGLEVNQLLTQVFKK
jgi:hypothetical protein